MVHGIKNSINFSFISITSNKLSANVMQCPMVKAVTSIKTFFQSFNK